MDRLFEPLASSSYLIAIANVVALATAAYFVWKAVLWLWRFAKSIYHNNIKDFIRSEKDRTKKLVDVCANDPSYFIAHILGKSTIITMAIVNIIMATSYLAFSSESECSRYFCDGAEAIMKISVIINVLFAIGYLMRLWTISLKVRRLRWQEISDIEDLNKTKH